jgi:hypothetical protein
MRQFNQLAGRGIPTQVQANPGRIILPWFATMGSGVRSSPGPPTNPFSIKHIAVFVRRSNYPSKTTLPFLALMLQQVASQTQKEVLT